MAAKNYKIGFDVGASGLKYAVNGVGGWECGCVRMPDNLMDADGNVTVPNAFSDFLKSTVKELKLPKGPAALTLPHGQVSCRLCFMPEMDISQLLINLPYEFSDFVHGGGGSYFYDYAVTPRLESDPEGQLSLMAACARKESLAGWVDMFSYAGIKLKKLMPQDMALVEACWDLDGETCFIDLGHRETRVVIISSHRVLVSRSIPIGGNDIDIRIADEGRIDKQLAGIKKDTGENDVLSLRGVSELCDKIALEILKVLNFYQFTYRPANSLEKAYLIGGGANMAILVETIRKATGLGFLNLDKLVGNGAEMRCAQAIGCVKGGE